PAGPELASAAASLQWLVDAGVDTFVADAPGNWLQAAYKLPAPDAHAADPAPAAPAKAAPAFPAAPVGPALVARTLTDLAEEASALQLAVRRPGAPFVFADGNPDSGVMIVGEAPGQQEERERRPFVGPAGQLLDRMMAAIGLDRQSAYITNLSPWRPPSNRTPSVAEAAECLPILERHIAIVRPRALLLVGGTSAKALLGTETGIMRLRGRWQDIEIEGASYPVMPTFHPAYLLRQPAQKRLVWRDLLAFQKRIRNE
ncbi:MAG: uracil-DNA glycosylase, partial [Pseudomonadota bacterium]